MNELISCMDCNRPGLLRLDMHPQMIEHAGGPGQRSRFCALPPRDIAHPPAKKPNPYPSPYKVRAACTCDTRRLEERAS